MPEKYQGFNSVPTPWSPRYRCDAGPTELWSHTGKLTVLITLHFHLQPQFKYEFHIYFTCTGRYELNKLTSLPMCGFTAQLVEYRTDIADVTGSNVVEALIFFRLAFSFQNTQRKAMHKTNFISFWYIQLSVDEMVRGEIKATINQQILY